MRARRTSCAALIAALAVLAGCSTIDPTAPSPHSGAPASASAPDQPSSPTERSSDAASTSGSGTPRPVPIWTGAVTRVAVTDPTGMVTPTCQRPPSQQGRVPLGPSFSATPPNWGPDQQLQTGTNHSVQAAAWAHPAAQVAQWMRSKSTAVAHKIAFLTFDDGPTGITTPEVLSILREKGVHATFFVIARQIGDVDAGLVRQAIADGNAVAIHSYSHNYHYLYPHRVATVTHVQCDLDWAEANLRAVLGAGYQTQAFRYPGGHMSWKGLGPSDAMLAQRGMTWIDWNAMSGDADATVPHGTADDLVNNVRRTARADGANAVQVVLSHDFYPNKLSVKALPRIIDDLKSAGFSFGIID